MKKIFYAIAALAFVASATPASALNKWDHYMIDALGVDPACFDHPLVWGKSRSAGGCRNGKLEYCLRQMPKLDAISAQNRAAWQNYFRNYVTIAHQQACGG